MTAAVALAVVGCSAGVMDRELGPGFGGSGGGDDDAAGTDTDTGPAADDSGSATDGPPMPDDDAGDAGDSGGPSTPTVRCDKIDFLVVIESGGLSEPQDDGEVYPHVYSYAKLREGFENLVSALYVKVDVDDFRVLVTGSSAVPGEFACEGQPRKECPMPVIDRCDIQLGAGRNGFSIPKWRVMECMSERFLESGHPDFVGAFWCLLDPYAGAGQDDRLMDALTLAVGDQAGSGMCNDGFLRDDALLVVLLLEQGGDLQADISSGTVASWHQEIADTKQGHQGNIVMLGLGPDGGAPQPLCSPSESDDFGVKLRELVEGFPNQKWASSCLPDYVPFFDEAADVIDAACEDFTPEG